MVEKAKRTDLLIRPNIENFSVIDFDLSKQIIEAGETAAKEQFLDLKALSIGQVPLRENVNTVKATDTLTVNRLILNGNDNYTRGYIKGKLRFNLDEKTSFKRLQQGISNLAATGNFKTIRYQLVSENFGTDLILNLVEEPTKTYIRMGLHYDDLYKSAALVNLTRKNALFSDDVASLDFILGDNIRYNFQYYIDKGLYWSFGINSSFNQFEEAIDFDVIRSNFDVTDDMNISNISLDVSDFSNQLYLQTVYKEEFAVTLGIEHKFLKYSTRTLSDRITVPDNPELPPNDNRTFFEKSNYLSAFGRLTLDTYDNKYFPSKGLYFNGDLHVYGFSSDFNDNFKEFSIGQAQLGAAFPILHNISLNIETEGGFKLGTSGITSFDFVLGGYGNELPVNFKPFLGYDFLSLPGNSYVKAYSRIDFEFVPKNHLMFAANVANVGDDLFRLGEWFTEPSFSGYGVGYGWESFAGPLQLMYTWTPQVSSSQVFVSLGYWF